MDMQWQKAEIIPNSKRTARQTALSEEEFGYLPCAGEQIYCVRHVPAGPRIGQILLAGCYAFCRERAYISWVRWARFLAAHGLEVLRFDYRGAGESTGDFVRMDFDSWLEDTKCCIRWLQDRGRGIPLVLHGFEMGALLTSKAFGQGLGDALLAWSPPASARDMLLQALQLHKIQQYAMRNPGSGRRNLVAELEAGRQVVVGGCTVSPRLWRQSVDLLFVEPRPQADVSGPRGVRPWRVFELDASAGPLCMSGSPTGSGHAEVGQLNPDLTDLFQENLDWIRPSLACERRGHAAYSAG